MTRMTYRIVASFIFTALLQLAGCAVLPEKRQAAAAPALPQETPEQIAMRETNTAGRAALKEGIDLYTAGDYNGAVRRLAASNEIWASDKAIQLEALKHMAFSYCVTNRPTLCKQQFEKALKLDSNFDLLSGEKGHPLWGPVFDRVKKAK